MATDWQQTAAQIRARDDHRCVNCGLEEDDHPGDLHVHHVVPAAEFDDREDADRPENLVTLCQRCHQSVEQLPPDEQRDRFQSAAPRYDGAVTGVTLRPIDHALLDYLQEQPITPAYGQRRYEDELNREYSRGYVQERLARFVRHGFAENQYDVGLYALEYDPREA